MVDQARSSEAVRAELAAAQQEFLAMGELQAAQQEFREMDEETQRALESGELKRDLEMIAQMRASIEGNGAPVESEMTIDAYRKSKILKDDKSAWNEMKAGFLRLEGKRMTTYEKDRFLDMLSARGIHIDDPSDEARMMTTVKNALNERRKDLAARARELLRELYGEGAESERVSMSTVDRLMAEYKKGKEARANFNFNEDVLNIINRDFGADTENEYYRRMVQIEKEGRGFPRVWQYTGRKDYSDRMVFIDPNTHVEIALSREAIEAASK